MSKTKLQKDLQKLWNLKTALILIIFIIASMLWFKYIAGLILIGIFAPLCFITIRYAKFVPHVTPESITATTIFMGYIYGPSIAIIYGFIVGSFALGANSHIKPASIASLVVALAAGALCSVLRSVFGLSLTYAFVISIIFRTIVAFPLMALIGTDPFENLSHQLSQLFFNLIIYLPLLTALYSLIVPFV